MAVSDLQGISILTPLIHALSWFDLTSPIALPIILGISPSLKKQKNKKQKTFANFYLIICQFDLKYQAPEKICDVFAVNLICYIFLLK